MHKSEVFKWFKSSLFSVCNNGPAEITNHWINSSADLFYKVISAEFCKNVSWRRRQTHIKDCLPIQKQPAWDLMYMNK